MDGRKWQENGKRNREKMIQGTHEKIKGGGGEEEGARVRLI